MHDVRSMAATRCRRQVYTTLLGDGKEAVILTCHFSLNFKIYHFTDGFYIGIRLRIKDHENNIIMYATSNLAFW